ncbi:zf-HC2 domain-containing protein [Thermohalobacter berrensis]|uniref:Anti-sigma-W factor RsiW n=1 Tax=Thermohalobacter berrensis TaxID=99594 RepID=A0A419T6X4_9FIRM|nr:zf-HC2 domain-containing protein [Thermohalobacter berrensis]RKD33169.1 hypothetical protein BET03_09635 [Thermohalobacter berrensis]
MDCKEFNENLSLYIDNELTMEKKEDFEAHLQHCQQCKKEYESMKLIVESLGSFKQVELPKNYKSELRRKLKNQRSRRTDNKKKINWRLYSALAACILIFIVSFGIISDNFIIQNQQNEMVQESLPRENIKIQSDNTQIAQEAETNDMKITALEEPTKTKKSPKVQEEVKEKQKAQSDSIDKLEKQKLINDTYIVIGFVLGLPILYVIYRGLKKYLKG